MTDLEAIERISKQLKEPLKELDKYEWEKVGYVIDESSRVTVLNLHDLELGLIPEEIQYLTELRILHLVANGIKVITNLSKLTKLETLVLQANEIEKISSLKDLRLLTDLHLSYNKISDISPIESLVNLTFLNIYNNTIKSFEPIRKLPLLTDLRIGDSENFDTSFFINCSNITHLRINGGLNKIDLEDNFLQNIAHLPLKSLSFFKVLNINLEGIQHLKTLKDLELSFCSLSNIEFISQLKLESIYFVDSNLTDTLALSKVQSLKSIGLRGTQITDLEPLLEFNFKFIWDDEKWNASDGEILIADCNNITNPPLEVVKQGHDAIMEYFRHKKASGAEPLLEAKLILLGDARAGKTSLASRLLKKALPKEADRTQGVDIVIGDYSFPSAEGRDFKLNIWDFAGQDKYKTLHQLFYTESSLYVMLAESGNATTDFDDWLQTAELFGEGSPLLIVLNEFKSGIGSGSFDATYWKKQFPDLLKEVFTVNLLTKDNFPKVEEYIRLLAQTLPHTKHEFPSNWAAIRRILNERRDEQYITIREYLQICKDNQLPDRKSALILSAVLHKIGDCLHYQKSGLLQQFIILKNEWATDAVYKIMDDSQVAEDKCGFFDQEDVQRIWSDEEYRDMRPQLLELMQQFKLAYQLPGKEEYVTPPLLPPARPAHFSWPEKSSLELYIEYEFLPKALMTQFIVDRHKDIAENRTLVWRNGAVLEWKHEALAEVSKTKLRGRDAIYIKSCGSNRKGMMTVILKTFRELHAEYSGIKCKEEVPCLCEGCRAKENKQHYFDFAYLKRRVEKGRFEAECNESLEEVNVLALLENTFILEKARMGQPLSLKQEVVRETPPPMRTLRLFLASSNELKAEREKIETALSRKNNLLRNQGFVVDLRIWENGKHIGTSFRSQDNYNLEVAECDCFIFLFYSKVGKFSAEEFEKAKARFDTNGTPRIIIFQKDVDLPKNMRKTDADSRFAFLDKLKDEEHFPELFENSDALVRALERAIDQLLLDDGFVEGLST